MFSHFFHSFLNFQHTFPLFSAIFFNIYVDTNWTPLDNEHPISKYNTGFILQFCELAVCFRGVPEPQLLFHTQ